jgi:hypothetical protein
MTPQIPDPTEYPTIAIKGEEYPLKWPISAIVKLKKEHNIDLADLAKDNGTMGIVNALHIIRIGVQHKKEFTIEELEDHFELKDLPRITAAVQAAFPKTSPTLAQTPEVPLKSIQ